MKLATWNVERVPSLARRERILAALEVVDADIWVLTETRTDLIPGPGVRSVFSCEPDRAGAASERWIGIASKFPVEQLRTTDPVRSAAALIRPAVGRPMVVFGTVLPWATDSWRGIRGLPGFLAALAVQRADWARLRAEHPNADFVVAGDFNQDLSDRHYYWSREGRVALLAALESAGLVALTADPRDPVRAASNGLRAWIDHICVPAESKWVAAHTSVWPAADTPDRRLSDHYGVAAEID